MVPEQEVLPGVSYVMPVLNEVQYLERAVRSILDQEYPGPTEIVLALGPSTDGTDAVVKKLVEARPADPDRRQPESRHPVRH